jgi:hypothetical protein
MNGPSVRPLRVRTAMQSERVEPDGRRPAEGRGVAVTPPGRGPHRPARSAWRRERGCAGPGVGVGHPPAERGGGVRHALGRATNPLADGLHRRRVRLQRRARHRVGPPAGHIGRAAGPRRGACGHPLHPRCGLARLRRRAAERTGPRTGARAHGGHPRARFQLVAWPSTGRPVRTPRGPCRGADPQAGAVLPRRAQPITNSTSSNPNRIIQVALYNAIWFAMPVAAVALARRRPVELQDFLRRTIEWVWRRQREIMITAFGILGVYLIVRGVVELRS